MRAFRLVAVFVLALFFCACLPGASKTDNDQSSSGDTVVQQDTATPDQVEHPAGCEEGLQNQRFCVSGTIHDLLSGKPIKNLDFSNFLLMVVNLSTIVQPGLQCEAVPIWPQPKLQDRFFLDCPLNKSKNANYDPATGKFWLTDLPPGDPTTQLVFYLVDLRDKRVYAPTLQLVPGYKGKVSNIGGVTLYALKASDADRIYRLEDSEGGKPVVFDNFWEIFTKSTAVVVKVVGDVKKSGWLVQDAEKSATLPAWPCLVTPEPELCNAIGLGTEPTTDYGAMIVPRPDGNTDAVVPKFTLIPAEGGSSPFEEQPVWFKAGLIWIAPFSPTP